MKIQQYEYIKCPKCNLKLAEKINFGKKAHCLNCNHIWKLSWRGSKSFTQNIRIELK